MGTDNQGSADEVVDADAGAEERRREVEHEEQLVSDDHVVYAASVRSLGGDCSARRVLVSEGEYATRAGQLSAQAGGHGRAESS